MKKSISLFFSLLILLSVLSLSSCNNGSSDNPAAEDTYGKILYVSPVGDDSNSGTKEAPLASLAGARDAVRALKAEEGLPDGGVCVLFADGEYPVNSTVEFSEEDSGEDGKPIVYMAENPRKARINAGFSLNAEDFKPLSNEEKERIISEEAKDKILVIDLAAAGCPDVEVREYATSATSSSANEYGCVEQTLYVDGTRQTVSRWPNEGYYYVEDNRGFTKNEGDEYWLFTIDDPCGHLDYWAKETGNLQYYGFPFYDYENRYLGVRNINTEEGLIDIQSHRGILAEKVPMYFFNMLCEMDTPGEYYIDYDSKKLYYYPIEDFSNQPIVFTQLDKTMIYGENVNHIGFDGLIIEGTRASAIMLSGNYQTFNDIEIRNIGIYALNLDGIHIRVSNSYIHDLDGAGIFIDDESWLGVSDLDSPTNTLEYSDVVITNNEIGFFGQKYGNSSPGVFTRRYGTVISHNCIHDNMHNAICWNAQNVTIEYNEIYNVCTDISDCGAITTGRNRDARGTMIRYNYFHDIVAFEDHYPNAVYIDDTTEQHTVFGNIFDNIAGRPVAISGDRYVFIENNIIINANNISWDNRGISWADGTTVWTYPDGWMWNNLLCHPIYSDLWKYSFPMNLIYSEICPASIDYIDYFGSPAYGRVCRNVNCEVKEDVYIKLAEEVNNPEMWDGTYTLYDGLLQIHEDALVYQTVCDNKLYDKATDLGFVDYENGNLNLRDDSPIFRDIVGFEKIPFDEIGLLK